MSRLCGESGVSLSCIYSESGFSKDYTTCDSGLPSVFEGSDGRKWPICFCFKACSFSASTIVDGNLTKLFGLKMCSSGILSLTDPPSTCSRLAFVVGERMVSKCTLRCSLISSLSITSLATDSSFCRSISYHCSSESVKSSISRLGSVSMCSRARLNFFMIVISW